jgi:hypothetical protein
MKLRPIASNMTEVEIGEYLVLFSYKTPVACRLPYTENQEHTTLRKTDKKWSATTTRHINKWFRDNFLLDDEEIKAIPEISQAELDNLTA